ncbi:MAG: TadE/TadG family type IV pilus assembly protein [Steroidobacteraceae bacterium]
MMRTPLKTRVRGLATVEFAICAPLLLLLMFATAELGRLFFQYNTLTKAVRDGARYVATHSAVGTTRVVNITTQVRTATQNLVVGGNTSANGTPLLPNLTPANVSVTNPGNGFVTVSATYTFNPVLGSLPRFVSSGSINLAIPLSATVTLRAL